MSSSRFNNGNRDHHFESHLCRFVGETVTIFTTSGGPSGCGFTGILLSVNCDFVRISTKQGRPPANPLSESICDFDNGCGGSFTSSDTNRDFTVGSVCDIPVDRIVSFCHNAV